MLEYTVGDYKGKKEYIFEIDGRKSYVICPDKPLQGNPWIWRAEFLGAFESVDLAMVEKGWYLCYHACCDMYGNPESIGYFKKFRDTVVKEFGLNKKTALFGFSRGGLYSANYALTYPDDVFALYLDAPVLDIRSWPGCMWRCTNWYENEWEGCKKCYYLADDEAAREFKGSPLFRAKELAEKKIPVIIVCGNADTCVPTEENCLPFYNDMTEAGGDIELIIKPDCGHHPHSLVDDPTPVVKFLEKRFFNLKTQGEYEFY